MYPYLIIGNLYVPTFSAMIIAGIYVGFVYFVLFVYSKNEFFTKHKFKLLLCVALGGLATFIGAFLFDSLFHSIEEGRFVIGGITYLGGMVVGIPVTMLLLKVLITHDWKLTVSAFSELIPSIAIAHCFGRIGCFLGGCCYGRETTSFIGVQFPDLPYKVIPTQLFESVFELILFILFVVLKKYVHGKQLFIYLASYGVFRFIIEFFRGDDRGSIGMFLSPSQLLSIACIISAVLMFLFYKGAFKKKEE